MGILLSEPKQLFIETKMDWFYTLLSRFSLKYQTLLKCIIIMHNHQENYDILNICLIHIEGYRCSLGFSLTSCFMLSKVLSICIIIVPAYIGLLLACLLYHLFKTLFLTHQRFDPGVLCSFWRSLPLYVKLGFSYLTSLLFFLSIHLFH